MGNENSVSKILPMERSTTKLYSLKYLCLKKIACTLTYDEFCAVLNILPKSLGTNLLKLRLNIDIIAITRNIPISQQMQYCKECTVVNENYEVYFWQLPFARCRNPNHKRVSRWINHEPNFEVLSCLWLSSVYRKWVWSKGDGWITVVPELCPNGLLEQLENHPKEFIDKWQIESALPNLDWLTADRIATLIPTMLTMERQ